MDFSGEVLFFFSRLGVGLMEEFFGEPRDSHGRWMQFMGLRGFQKYGACESLELLRFSRV